MDKKPPFDWLGFFCQSIYGAIFGVGAGLAVFVKSPYVGSPSYMPMICFMGIGALVCGVLSGFIGDELWRQL